MLRFGELASRAASSSRIISRVSDSRRRKRFNSAKRDGSSRAGRPSPVLRTPCMSGSQERRHGLSRTPCGWRATRGDAIFDPHALLHQEFPLPMRPLRVFLFHGRHDHGPASTGIAGKLCGQDAKEPDRVQAVGFIAAGASSDQDAGRLDNLVDHAVRGQKSMQPKSIPALASKQLTTSVDASSEGSSFWVPQAGDESKQSCAVARLPDEMGA